MESYATCTVASHTWEGVGIFRGSEKVWRRSEVVLEHRGRVRAVLWIELEEPSLLECTFLSERMMARSLEPLAACLLELMAAGLSELKLAGLSELMVAGSLELMRSNSSELMILFFAEIERVTRALWSGPAALTHGGAIPTPA